MKIKKKSPDRHPASSGRRHRRFDLGRRQRDDRPSPPPHGAPLWVVGWGRSGWGSGTPSNSAATDAGRITRPAIRPDRPGRTHASRRGDRELARRPQLTGHFNSANSNADPLMSLPSLRLQHRWPRVAAGTASQSQRCHCRVPGYSNGGPPMLYRAPCLPCLPGLPGLSE